MNLRQVGEDELVRRITSRLPRNRDVLSAAGDDCAVVRFRGSDRLLLLKTDCVVEGVHFDSCAKAVDVGWKAMARPLSDFAAMAGVPQFALVTFIAPGRTGVEWTRAVYRGLTKAARFFDVAIVGGETSRIDGPLAISVSVSGFVEKDRCVRRSGGKPGDDLFVTGRLGGSIRGKHLRFRPRIAEARWLTQHVRVHAMMDLSDGLGADLPRLARASEVGFELDEASIPRTPGCTVEQAISDGEDYELLFATSPAVRDELSKKWKRKFPKLPLTRIGSLVQKSKTQNQKSLRGYVHFQ
jgi:thiamine-monophosphate kinase